MVYFEFVISLCMYAFLQPLVDADILAILLQPASSFLDVRVESLAIGYCRVGSRKPLDGHQR